MQFRKKTLKIISGVQAVVLSMVLSFAPLAPLTVARAQESELQGAGQGADQGSGQGAGQGDTSVSVENTGTGAGSTNNATSDTDSNTTTSTSNTSTTTNNADGTANSGGNTGSENTGNGAVASGNSGVGVQQVTADNLNVSGTQGEVDHNVVGGTQNGDLVLDFNPTQSGSNLNDSFRSVNSVTGAGSTNDAQITNTQEKLTEIQNDGRIDNSLTAEAISGRNDASRNTGDGTINTGDADVAATLVNFLNVNVTDGLLWLDVTDIFGDLNGNIVIPKEILDLFNAQKQQNLTVDAGNSNTGANSTNNTGVDVNNNQTTGINNDALINNNVTVDAITGQNQAEKNTGSANVNTGDVKASTNAVNLANLNVVDGSLGLIMVNAIDRWLAFFLGEDGSIRPVENNSTITAQNSSTGANSNNNANTTIDNNETVGIDNNAVINNDVDLRAITGQNTANENTGDASITTGNAKAQANLVNIANTNVVRGNMFVAVVNIFGKWAGDLFFGDQKLSGQEAASGVGSNGGGSVEINGSNQNTGSGSTNNVDVALNSNRNTDINNDADINNNFNLNADTGHNKTNKNTGAGQVDTGDALGVLRARNIANLSLVYDGPQWTDLTAGLLNSKTGADSTNTIDVNVNDTSSTTITNEANVDTVVSATANSGENEANENTLGGMIVTGMAKIKTYIDNILNKTILGGVDGDPSVELSLENEKTGANSDNTNFFNFLGDHDTNISNVANVTNDVDAEATTGGNEASRNTGGGLICTGDASISGGVDNEINKTKGGMFDLTLANVGNIFNGFDADASSGNNLANENTGKIDKACPQKEEEKPTPTPTPEGPKESPKGEGEGGNGGQGDGEVKGEEKESAPTKVSETKSTPKPRVAEAEEERPESFPIAGAYDALRDLFQKILPWVLIAAAVVLGYVAFVPKLTSLKNKIKK